MFFFDFFLTALLIFLWFQFLHLQLTILLTSTFLFRISSPCFSFFIIGISLPRNHSPREWFSSYNRIRERRCVPVSCCYALAGREQREAVCPTKSSLCGWNWRLKQEKHHFWYNDDVQAVSCSMVNRDLPSTVPKTPSLYLILRYPVPGGFFLVSFPWYSPRTGSHDLGSPL